jgi:phosphatidylglycerol:prolipoprotein diacylglycerol transferase
VRPVLFTWRGHDVHAYSVAIYVGIVLGIVTAQQLAPTVGLDPFRVWLAALLLVTPSLVGSRALWVITYWPRYRDDRAAIWRKSESGGALYGGLLLALLVSVPVLAMLRLPFGAFWDLASFTLLVGMICTRVGCVMHGCCSGRVTNHWVTWSLPCPDGVRRRRIPTQLLEAGLSMLVLALALAVLPRLGGGGGVFLIGTVAYAAGRAALETTREDVMRVGGVSVNGAISGALIVAVVALLAALWR